MSDAYDQLPGHLFSEWQWSKQMKPIKDNLFKYVYPITGASANRQCQLSIQGLHIANMYMYVLYYTTTK